MTNDWQKDPRVLAMDPKKIRFLTDFADRAAKAPKAQLMHLFLSLTFEAKQKGILFSDEETELLTQLLLPHMTPKDREKLDLFRSLSKTLAQKTAR